VSVDVTALVGGAVGGAAIQTIFGPLFGQVHYRRELRAKVLNALAEVERERWASSEDRSGFRAAIGQLRSTALVAGVNRELVDSYALAAAASYGHSLRDWERHGNPDGGGISMPLSHYVTQCAEALTFYVWHPRWAGAIRRLTMRRLQKARAKTSEEMKDQNEPIHWDSVWLPR
jgi:hypothetical protein